MSRDRVGAGEQGKLVITNWRDLAHPDAGGAELVCQELAARYAARGLDVVLLSASVSGQPRSETRDGYTIVRGGGRFTVYAHALWWLLRHRRSVSAVLDSQNGIPFFTPLVVRPRTPAVMLLHHVHQEQFAGYFPPPVAAFGRFLESTASRAVYRRRAVVAVSPSTRTDARRLLGLRGSLWVAPPGLSATPKTTVDRSTAPTIVTVGRLVHHKQVAAVIAALPDVLRRHPHLTMTFIGRGPERDALLDLAEQRGVAHAVRIHGDLDDLARDRALSSAWMSVTASQGEGWGLSVVEANAQGVPVLAYRRPGLRDSIIDGETGWLIDERTDLATAIADRLDQLSDPDIAARFARNARHWAASFTWDSMADRIHTVLEYERERLASRTVSEVPVSDTATVLTVPVELLPDGWSLHLRRSDISVRDRDVVRVLCMDTDVVSAETVLARWGLAPGAPNRYRVHVDVARTRDYLSLRRPIESVDRIDRITQGDR